MRSAAKGCDALRNTQDFVVEGGHGHVSEMVGEGVCEMMIGDESCCSWMALAM